MKNTLLLYRSTTFTLTNIWKNRKNLCPLAGICSTLKFDFPQISVIFSSSRKKLGIKKILFPVDKKLVFTSWNEKMRDALKNMFQLKKKLLPLVAVDCCMRKWKKMVSTSQKISLHYLKYVLYFKIGFL